MKVERQREETEEGRECSRNPNITRMNFLRRITGGELQSTHRWN